MSAFTKPEMDTPRDKQLLFSLLATAFLEPPTADLVETLQPLLGDEPPPASFSDLERGRAFTRLLVGPGEGYVPPYASIYVNAAPHEKPLLCGAEAAAVKAEYAAAGLELAPGGQQLPDHLGIELQFLAHLCRLEAEARETIDESAAQTWRARRAEFIRLHLLNWLPAFAGRLQAVSAHPFYARLTTFLIQHLAQEASEVVKTVEA